MLQTDDFFKLSFITVATIFISIFDLFFLFYIQNNFGSK